MGLFRRSNSSSSTSSTDGLDSDARKARAAFRDRMAADCRSWANDPNRSDEERAGCAANADQYEREAKELRKQR
jgi:hypothetical protein